LKICQPQMQISRVQYSLEMAEKLPRVQGDSNQILQVFSNIINNAAHAMTDRGGTLTVTTSSDGQTVTIQFADTGAGMTEPERVFDPFYTTRPVGQGTGLGLSACYGIVQEHGGQISCRNREEGGATFLIELPAVGSARATESHAQAHAAK
jgi:two-component system NtrC family sensor kinase